MDLLHQNLLNQILIPSNGLKPKEHFPKRTWSMMARRFFHWNSIQAIALGHPEKPLALTV